MKNLTRFLITVLALISCISMFSVPVMANSNPTVKTDETVIASGTGSTGRAVRGNGYHAWSWKISGNNSKFTLTIEQTDGITPLDAVTGKVVVKDSKGRQIFSEYIARHYFYEAEWTFNVPIESVEEKISFSGTLVTDLTSFSSSYPLTEISISRDQFKGGAIGQISPLDGERHHTFAQEVYTSVPGGIKKYDSSLNTIGTVSPTYAAPSILMTVSDHQKTASWGNTSSSKKYRNMQLELVKDGYYYEAVMMDVNDIRNKFGDKYDWAISDMLEYCIFTLNWYR